MLEDGEDEIKVEKERRNEDEKINDHEEDDLDFFIIGYSIIFNEY